MKKLMVAVLAIVALVFVTSAGAETFYLPKNVTKKVPVVVDPAIGVKTVEQYKFYHSESGHYSKLKARIDLVNNSTELDVYEGDRFQILNAEGAYAFWSPEMKVANIKYWELEGAEIDCSNPKGCCLQVLPGAERVYIGLKK